MKRFVFCCILMLSLCAAARAQTLSFIRDTEVEEVLHGYLRAIFTTAGLPAQNAQIALVNDPSINAFVAGGQTVFIHTGLIMQAATVDDVVFVLAHETGHIIGGHVVRGYGAYQSSQTTALISTVLGGLIAVVSGAPEAGIAIMAGGSSSAMGVFSAYRQGEENIADRIAVDILAKMGYSLHGFQSIMGTILAQERLNANTPYMQTHPLTQERQRSIAHLMQNTPPPRSDIRFELVKAKLAGFLAPPAQVLKQHAGDTLPERYARAIALYRSHQIAPALQLLDRLIGEQPQNPYFHELKAQFLFETGQIEPAVSGYAQAVSLKPRAPLMLLSYAQALLETDAPQNARTAEDALKKALVFEKDTPMAWRLLAKAYERQGKKDMTQYAMAAFYHASGKPDQAKRLAERIKGRFEEGTQVHQHLSDMIEIPAATY